MADSTKYALLTAALAALVFGPFALWYQQDQLEKAQRELVASIPQLTEVQIQGCHEGLDPDDIRLKTEWQPLIDYYAWLLCVMGEPPLPKSLPHDGVVMRLLVMPSFDPPYMIRAQSFPFEHKTYLVELADGADQASVSSRSDDVLTPEELANLTATLETISFWELPTPNPSRGLDGSMWVLEVVMNDRYHAVERWSGGELEPVGLLLAEPYGRSIY